MASLQSLISFACITGIAASFLLSPSRVFLCLYVLGFLFLYINRALKYIQRRWLFFLVDTCYFLNAWIIFILYTTWKYPGQGYGCHWFYPLFYATIAWCGTGVIVWGNSFTLYNVDRLTSCYIHIMPVATLYVLRWYVLAGGDSESACGFADGSYASMEQYQAESHAQVTSSPSTSLFEGLMELPGSDHPLLYVNWFLALHGVIAAFVFLAHYIAGSESDTSMTYMVRAQKGGVLVRIMDAGASMVGGGVLGQVVKVFVYAAICQVYGVAAGSLSILMFSSYQFHLGYIAFIVTAASYNAIKFERSKRRKEKRKAEEKTE